MSSHIVAELSADERHLILIATGEAHEVAAHARRLQLFTPLVKATQPPGAMQMPLTWGAVVQATAEFGSDWRPGPRLTAWITAQFAARVTAPDQETAGAEHLHAPVPEGLVPRPYQVAGARMIGLVGSAMLFDDPGPQPVDTPIATPGGPTTLGALVVDQDVFDVDGRPARVRAIKHFGEMPVWRVTFSDRTSTLATDTHRWQVLTPNDRKRGGLGRKMATRELLAAGLHHQSGRHRASSFFLPQQPVIQGSLGSTGAYGWYPLDPYAYGALLGDGALGGETLSVTCPDAAVLDAVEKAAWELGTTARRPEPGERCPSVVLRRDGRLRDELAALDALHGAAGKRVHDSYRLGDERTRRAVLAGLLDTDGSVTGFGTGVEFGSASALLASDVAWLGRTVGAVVTECGPHDAGYRDRVTGEWVECLPSHRVQLRFPADGPNPFRLARKAESWAAMARIAQRRNPPRAFEAIEPEGTAQVCCIELDRDLEHERVYLTDTALIPTSNTGKTVTTLLGLRERAVARHPVCPVLIICPSSVVDDWVHHVRRWCPGWRAVAWRGSPQRRRNLLGTADVYVASYGTAARDAANADPRRNPLIALGATYVIADEVHRIKAQATAQSTAVRRLAERAQCFVGLSGTPITHHVGDLWPALYCLSPGAFPSRERWLERYCDVVSGDYSVAQVLGLSAHREPEFRNSVLGQYRRVSKADVLSHLPPKVWSMRTVELPAAHRKAYDAIESDMLAHMPDSGAELSPMDTLSQLNNLVMLANAPADVETWHETVEDPETGLPVLKRHQNITLKAPSWKVTEALEVMAERPGARCILTAPSRQLVMLAGQAATEAGYRVGYVVGGQSNTERRRDIDAFQAGELDAIAISTGAGGVGLTLTAAQTLIFLQRPWSIVEALQVEDRCHRLGSEAHSHIDIVDIVAENTIESRMREALVDKAQNLADLVRDPRIVTELLGGTEVRSPRKAVSVA